jgi:hypothetical protein
LNLNDKKVEENEKRSMNSDNPPAALNFNNILKYMFLSERSHGSSFPAPSSPAFRVAPALTTIVVKPFSCERCARTFNSKYNVVRHLKQYHAERRMFKCAVCAREYKWVDSLHKHMKVHKSVALSVGNPVTSVAAAVTTIEDDEFNEDPGDEELLELIDDDDFLTECEEPMNVSRPCRGTDELFDHDDDSLVVLNSPPQSSQMIE